ncbi:hypothetical protein ACIRF8_31340 [Streptomyces sp. NPDC102406]|uniref:hypothetical protein n=1 Tax=Streptomyces sp. NPDC102406 TaxID=3366171 RepID=UPI00382FFBD5
MGGEQQNEVEATGDAARGDQAGGGGLLGAGQAVALPVDVAGLVVAEVGTAQPDRGGRAAAGSQLLGGIGDGGQGAAGAQRGELMRTKRGGPRGPRQVDINDKPRRAIDSARSRYGVQAPPGKIIADLSLGRVRKVVGSLVSLWCVDMS